VSILKIRKYGDPILRKKCQEVKDVNQEIKRLADDMTETMFEFEGAGLAAPQIGEEKRVITANLGNRKSLSLINPEILKKTGKIIMEEGCLSLPDIFVEVKRPEKVIVEGLDKDGKKVRIKAKALLSRILQHEIDHLNGILMIDRIPFWKRWKLREELREIKQNRES